MPRTTLRQRLRYQFDNFMSRGGSSILLGLVLFFLAAWFTFALLRGLVNTLDYDGAASQGGFFHHFFQTFTHLSDPGSMAGDVESDWWFKLTAIGAGLVGVVLFSSLIAFITTWFQDRMHSLKKGHSKVIEEGHTLILGWNERVLEILRELVIANESESDACVVILAEREKEVMDDFLALHLPNRKSTRVVTRSGSTSSLVNLDVVSADKCKTIIALANCEQGAGIDDQSLSDAIVIKTVLAAVASRPANDHIGMVAEVFRANNRRIIDQIVPGDIVTVDTNEILAKIIVQTSRSVGLSQVYAELLGFEGSEMYFHHAAWKETTFAQLAYHWPDGILMGLRHADGGLSINPHPDKLVLPDDEVLILAEDDSTIQYRTAPVISARDLPLPDRRQEPRVERELIIGWTPKVEIILREYADYVLKGSQFDIMLRAANGEVRGQVEQLNRELPDVTIRLLDEDPLTTEGLLAVEPFRYDNIILLSQSGDNGSDERTDSETIIILLMLRRIFSDQMALGVRTKLITEVLDSRNQPLVARTGVKDFIISNRFVSMLLAQISEHADVKRVYDDLFEEEGSEIYLKPATLYFDQFPAEVSFADLMGLTQKREEVCLGIKLKALESDEQHNFGVRLNPPKDTCYSLTAEDTLVVLAETEA